MKKLLSILFILTISQTAAFAKTYEAFGEATITHNDTASAKNVAISRAKWAAIEQASGVKVKIDTIMLNAELADEAVKSELSATVKSYKILDEGKDGDIYWVAISADVIPENAEKTISQFAKNTNIVVFIPATLTDGNVEVNQAFTNEVIKQLQGKGFEVISIDNTMQKELENAVESNNLTLIDDIISKTMASSFLIGSLKIVEQSGNIGYGNVNFALVNGQLAWQLISHVEGKNVVVTTGSKTARGQGNSALDASYYTYRTMGRTEAPKIASDVASAIFGTNAKSVRVALKGNTSMSLLRELEEDVRNVPFALDIKTQGISSLLVNYPEKTYYLASFLERNFKYKVLKISDDEIIVERR